MPSSQKLHRVGNWMLGRKIGLGSYGIVREGIHVKTGLKAAIKVVDSSKLKTPGERRSLLREISIHTKMEHPNITKVYEVLQSEDRTYIMMELIDGGDLFQSITQVGKLAEPVARSLFYQMLEAVSYCHKSNVIHRDIKLENFLVDAELKTAKLTDFGLSTLFAQDKYLTTYCGSTYYVAPEIILATPYSGVAADMWSLGITLFAMVTGRLPFVDNTGKLLLEKALEGITRMPAGVSPEVAEVIKMLIQPEPEQRATFEQLFSHPWVAKGASKNEGRVKPTSSADLLKLDLVTISQPRRFSCTFDPVSPAKTGTTPRALSSNTMASPRTPHSRPKPPAPKTPRTNQNNNQNNQNSSNQNNYTIPNQASSKSGRTSPTKKKSSVFSGPIRWLSKITLIKSPS